MEKTPEAQLSKQLVCTRSFRLITRPIILTLRTKKDLETLELNLEVPFAVIDRDVLAKCRSVQQHHETKILFAKLSTTADRPVIYQ